ncbi:hypothetical protein [Streptomyces sp. NPDC000410]|uniref:hypothetical protein n=1 Tax=Streptomyces sp. NPDC000410 TaxID=3154254 RepID=UPI00332AC42C
MSAGPGPVTHGNGEPLHPGALMRAPPAVCRLAAEGVDLGPRKDWEDLRIETGW